MAMTQLVILLRGINVGASKRVKMAALRELLEELGYAGVRTHLQSGNAVVGVDDAPDEVARGVERQIEAKLGLSVDVTVRTADKLAEIVAADPLGSVATDPSRYLVIFLSAEPDSEALRGLAQQRAELEPERFDARGREVYAWCPDGVHSSPLTKALTAAKLAPSATARNWRTVTKLLEMTRAS